MFSLLKQIVPFLIVVGALLSVMVGGNVQTGIFLTLVALFFQLPFHIEVYAQVVSADAMKVISDSLIKIGETGKDR